MARYTICGVVYSDALATNGVPVNIVLSDAVEFYIAKQEIKAFPAYHVTVTVRCGEKIAAGELVKMPK